MRRKIKSNINISLAHAKEVFVKIKINIDFVCNEQSHKCLLITSSIPSEGKSTIAANLAIAMSESGKKTLLVDADMRQPIQHKLFNLLNRQGLSTILAGLSWQDYVLSTNNDNLQIISAGPIPPNPAALLGSNRMKAITTELKREYDYIIFDTPPIQVVPDAVSLSQYTDGILFIVKQNSVSEKLLLNSAEQLKLANAKIIGTVLSMATNISNKSTGYYNQYGYYNKNLI